MTTRPFRHSRAQTLIAAVLLCAAQTTAHCARPLKGLPSKPGPHVARIRALGNNQWLKLGKPRPDPKYGPAPGRSYTNKMTYAQGLGGAFLYGEGVHGKAMMRGGKLHYNDDLFFYDINAHAWICVHPGTAVKSFTRKIDKNGFEVTADGQHVPIAIAVHGYECNVYVPELKSFLTLETGSPYWRKHLKARRSKWLEGVKWGRVNGKHPFFYNIATGRWQRHKTNGPGPQTRYCASLIHLPNKKRVAYYDRNNDFWFYDYVTKRWSHVKPNGLGPDTADYEGVSCYDSKRHRIYAFNRNRKEAGTFGIYDVAKNAWIKSNARLHPDRLVGTKGYGSVSASAHYDVANDVVMMRLNGDGHSSLYVYDPGKDEWQPKPVSRLPKIGSRRWSLNSFYDPELNAHFFFECGDSRASSGVINVYRYKKTPKRVMVK